jgi:hypothetical protein
MKLKIKKLTNKKKSYSKFGATITKISNLKNEGWWWPKIIEFLWLLYTFNGFAIAKDIVM